MVIVRPKGGSEIPNTLALQCGDNTKVAIFCHVEPSLGPNNVLWTKLEGMLYYIRDLFYDPGFPATEFVQRLR